MSIVIRQSQSEMNPWKRWVNGGSSAWKSDTMILFFSDNLWTASISVPDSPHSTEKTTITTHKSCPTKALSGLNLIVTKSELPVTKENLLAFEQLPKELQCGK